MMLKIAMTTMKPMIVPIATMGVSRMLRSPAFSLASRARASARKVAA